VTAVVPRAGRCLSRDHGPTELAEYVRLEDFEPAARRVLEPSAYACVTCGAGDELTVARNREAFARRTLRGRVLVDVSPAAMVVLAHSAVLRVREKTTLRAAFMMGENGWSSPRRRGWARWTP
jgi:hypothetical protein